MDSYEYRFKLKDEIKPRPLIRVGVAGSGNVEVLVNANPDLRETLIRVYTNVSGFKATWDEVIKRFIEEYPYGGLAIELHDAGATPPVVELRLRQALETYQGGYDKKENYTEASARSRIFSLADADTFTEFLLNQSTASPTLPQMGIQVESDDGVVIGSAQFAGKLVAIASQQKDFIGGSVGEAHGAKLTGLIRYAIKQQLSAIVLLIDSGGVRLQEANVGEIAISEIIRAILDARSKGIKTLGVICGNNGAYGGMGIICGTLDYLIVNQGARIGVSGAEVIQAVEGTEVLDSSDRPLIWRIYGGRTRFLQSAAQAYTSNKIPEIRAAIIEALTHLEKQKPLNLEQIKKEHIALQQRKESAKNCNEEGQWLAKHAPVLAKEDIFDCSDEKFLIFAQQEKKREQSKKK